MFRLSDTVTLPANAPTQTFAYLGTRGSGKSYGAGVQVEEFLRGNVQVVIVDPVGIWWALRYAADGKSPGLKIPVFGGWHGDIPLEATGGELVAQLVAERRMSVVLDVSEFTYGQQRRFVADFSTLLFALKKRNKSPIHLVFEEGHEFFPQMVEGAAAEMAGATKRLWKIGRNFGIGGTIISQRAAEVNKGALNLTDVVVTGQLKAPNDVKTIAAWCNDNGADDAAIKQLPKQPKGVLTVWGGHGAVTTTFRKKLTLDASKTPEADDDDHQAQALPPIDLAAVRTAMAATIEDAKANDPKALREEIARLRSLLVKASCGPTPGIPHALGEHFEIQVKLPPVEPPARPAPPKKPAVKAYVPTQPKEGWTDMEEDLYQKFKARLLAEVPGLIKVFATQPELEVTIERRVVEADGKTLRGRLALLVSQGWFDEVKAGNAAYNELQRLGFSTAKPNVYRELDALAALGIVTKEQGGYQLAPGAKVNIKKAA